MILHSSAFICVFERSGNALSKHKKAAKSSLLQNNIYAGNFPSNVTTFLCVIVLWALRNRL